MILDALRFHIEKAGEEHLPGVLFLHGFLGSTRDWNSVMQVCSERCFCLALDLPGHGKTIEERDDVYAMSFTAAAIVGVLKQWPNKKWIVVGYSMGGRLALYLALHYGEYFDAGVIISASPGLQDQHERLLRQKGDMELIMRLKNVPLVQFISDWYAQPLFGTLTKHPEFEKIVAERLQNHPERLALSLKHMGLSAQPSLWPLLRGCQVRLQLMCGEKDEKFVALAKRMHALCPHSQLEIIPGCGHNLCVEAPDRIAARLI